MRERERAKKSETNYFGDNSRLEGERKEEIKERLNEIQEKNIFSQETSKDVEDRDSDKHGRPFTNSPNKEPATLFHF